MCRVLKADANGSESESEGAEKNCTFDCNYGDTNKISGCYFAVVMEAVGLEVTVKEHEKICGCDLNDPDTPHFLDFLEDVDDDTDNGVEDLDAGDDDSEDEAMVGEEVDHIDEGSEDGDEDDGVYAHRHTSTAPDRALS